MRPAPPRPVALPSPLVLQLGVVLTGVLMVMGAIALVLRWYAGCWGWLP